MSNFEHERQNSPLPVDLESAIKEILDLRRILIKERQILAKNIERRELDCRSLSGSIAALRNENAALRKEISALQQELSEK